MSGTKLCECIMVSFMSFQPVQTEPVDLSLNKKFDVEHALGAIKRGN